MKLDLVIPQMFYLIGRIIPGLIIILASYIVWRGNNITAEDIFKIGDRLVSKEIIFFILISYMLAFILDGIWNFIAGVIYKNTDLIENGDVKRKALLSFSTVEPNLIDIDTYQFPDIYMMYDYIRLKNDIVGARLAKVRAEYSMCRILIVGFTILTAVNLLNFQSGIFRLTMIIECILIFSLCIIIKNYFHYKFYFQTGIYSYWLLLFELDYTNNKNKNR